MEDSLGEIDPGSALRKASDSWIIDFQWLKLESIFLVLLIN